MKNADVEACARLPLEDEVAYDAEARALLPDLWRELLAGGCAETTVLEDWDLPAGRRLVGFSFIVFLTDAYVAEAKCSPAPYVNRRITDAWRAGQSPILNIEAVRAANSGEGVNQHTFHQSYPGMMPSPPPQMLQSVMEAFIQLCAGYHIKEATIEVYGPAQLQMNLNGGFRLRNDYGAYPEQPGAILPSRGRPYLIGLTRAESAVSPGSVLSLIFHYSPPRFFFKLSEQEMLQRALWGETDEEIAQSQYISVTAVRKRWLAIYGRVSAVNPALLPTSAEAGTANTRGLEKRRTLLNYLRSHWEELRPIQALRPHP